MHLPPPRNELTLLWALLLCVDSPQHIDYLPPPSHQVKMLNQIIPKMLFSGQALQGNAHLSIQYLPSLSPEPPNTSGLTCSSISRQGSAPFSGSCSLCSQLHMSVPTLDFPVLKNNVAEKVKRARWVMDMKAKCELTTALSKSESA